MATYDYSRAEIRVAGRRLEDALALLMQPARPWTDAYSMHSAGLRGLILAETGLPVWAVSFTREGELRSARLGDDDRSVARLPEEVYAAALRALRELAAAYRARDGEKAASTSFWWRTAETLVLDRRRSPAVAEADRRRAKEALFEALYVGSVAEFAEDRSVARQAVGRVFRVARNLRA